MRHLLFICLLLFCVACEENESVDPTIMPEATTTGANTFGCLVDGWVYTSGRWGMPSAEYLEREEGSSVTVSAQVGLGSYIRFTIADPKEGETLPYVNLSLKIKYGRWQGLHLPYVGRRVQRHFRGRTHYGRPFRFEI